MYALVGSNKVRKETVGSNKRSSSSSGSNTRVRDDGYYSTFNSINKAWVGSDMPYLRDPAGDGLVSLNLNGCTSLSAPAVQAVCDAFPQLHTCTERWSLIVSGCLRLTTVHCICVTEARREHLHRAQVALSAALHPLQLPIRI